MIKLVFSKDSLYIKDIKNLTKSLESFIHTQTIEKYRKRGIVVGISGGIDSAVVASLASNAVGKENILGLILPLQALLNFLKTEFAAETLIC